MLDEPRNLCSFGIHSIDYTFVDNRQKSIPDRASFSTLQALERPLSHIVPDLFGTFSTFDCILLVNSRNCISFAYQKFFDSSVSTQI